MATAPAAPTTIDEYIAAFPPNVQAILQKIRATIRKAAPDAEEVISYRMPSFKQRVHLVYFGGFKTHVGLYPPVRNEALRAEAAPYAGDKGNLRFPLDQPIPYTLISKMVKARLKETQATGKTKTAARKPATAR